MPGSNRVETRPGTNGHVDSHVRDRQTRFEFETDAIAERTSVHDEVSAVSSVATALPMVEGQIEWDVLFESQQQRLLTLAHLIVRNREDAADVVQRVFEKTYRHRHRLDPSLSPAAWLTRLTCNEAISLSRRRGHFTWLSLNGRERTASHEDSTIDHVLVDRALRRLRPKHRAVVVLFYLHGYSLAEIATMLGVPRGTVASRLHHARTTLASLMPDHDLRRLT